MFMAADGRRLDRHGVPDTTRGPLPRRSRETLTVKARSVRTKLGRGDREIVDGARCPSRAGRLTTPMISVPVKPTVTSPRSGGWLKRPRRA